MPRVKMNQADMLDAGITWFASRTTTNFDGLDGRAYFLTRNLTKSQRKAVTSWKNTAIRTTSMPGENGKPHKCHIVIIYDKIIPRKRGITPGRMALCRVTPNLTTKEKQL